MLDLSWYKHCVHDIKDFVFFCGNDAFVFLFPKEVPHILMYFYVLSLCWTSPGTTTSTMYKDSFFMGMMCLCCSFPKEEVPYILMYFHVLDWVELHLSLYNTTL